MLMNVAYCYRKKNTSFSIERVFDEIRAAMPPAILQSEFFCLHGDYKNPLTYWQNISDAKKVEADVFHITGAIHYLAYAFPKARTLVTVHDLDLYLREKNSLRRFFIDRLFFSGPLKRVSKIVAISEFTKSQIISNMGIHENKITVIGDPAPSGFLPVPKTFNAAEPRILCFCHMHTKNFERHIRALAGVPCHLRVIGKIAPEFKSLLESEKISYSNAFDLSSGQIIEEYVQCDMLLFASTYEGFGVPVLEAQLTGRPVVTSHAASLADVARDTAAIADPLDITSIRRAVQAVIDSPNLRDELIARGFENVKRFSPRVISEKYCEIYSEMNKGMA